MYLRQTMREYAAGKYPLNINAEMEDRAHRISIVGSHPALAAGVGTLLFKVEEREGYDEEPQTFMATILVQEIVG